MMISSISETRAFRPIELPPPANDGSGSSLFTALERRRTTRHISAAPLPMPLLSNLLWAAYGVNRKTGPFGTPGRTAASASNSQEIDLYVALRDGVYLYNAVNNLLAPVVARDLRVGALTPRQKDVDASAPIQLLYIADVHRLTDTTGFQEPGVQDPEIQKSYYYVDTGLIAGNVYLFAAAHGLAAWFHNCDKPGLALHLGLRAEQRVLFAQSVGYPEKCEHSRPDATPTDSDSRI
jgi:nitroreductase